MLPACCNLLPAPPPFPTLSLPSFRVWAHLQVFEEARNLCLGLASRGIDWRQQGLRGTVAICVGIASKLFSNLMARCDNIAIAMSARGFQGPNEHELREAAPPVMPLQRLRGIAADAGLLLLLAVLFAAASLVV